MSNPDFNDLGDFDEAIEVGAAPEATSLSKKAARQAARDAKKAAREAKKAEKKAAQAVRSAARNAAVTPAQPVATAGTSRLDVLKGLTVYDAMLIASALAISLAILLMFLELMSFESGIFFQWRTSEAFAKPITPP